MTADARHPGHRSLRRPSRRRGASVNRPDTNRRSTAIPQTVPSSVGAMSTHLAPARVSTAAHPATPASPIVMLPNGIRWVSPAPGECGDHGDHSEHDDRQGQLVGGAEQLDRPFLDGSGREVDDGRADGGSGVCAGAERNCGQLGYAERDRSRSDTCQGAGTCSRFGHAAKVPITRPERLTGKCRRLGCFTV